ncbi:MAG: acyl-phosphate glycerol 3-phosphate acyltransferase [Chloroflexi bacterium]|jgi:glycerol-3-phosphate acyltransferase PlsY|nr:glycerol-3-phosphate 1-O-acyltransferase PlsY [Dehalococcoidia bacterium]RUA30496.1 MAG: acyl-phosphate glycerol 3-phosphate acyltransferase [Chloroflexota bacterium]|tara:strand:- start:605 stop:1324 length:720 start_codon:yes stop_codon:yes gene_type:complete
MNRPFKSIIIQAVAIPFIIAGVVIVLLTMDGQSEAARYSAVLPLAYLLGSISWGYMLLQWKMGVDVREFGSGRTGMSNVLRTGGAKSAVVVLTLDIGKGVMAVVLAREVIGTNGAEVAAGLIVLAGHNWPVFLQFKGGRGILTALGGLALMVPVAAIIATATFLTVIALSRYISLGSVIGVTIGALAILALALAGVNSGTYMVYGFIACAMLVWQHRDNLQRIRDGNERRLGQPATKVE